MSIQTNCSHFVVLPSITADNHLYEWKYDEEDRRFCTTKINGRIAHIGFSMLLFG
ncbi:MAG: hypothetical protein V3V33_09615 [Candidatus Lokiarchaeia archaeon]